jgi:hypothetical protein
MVITAIETIVLIYYCNTLQNTLKDVSSEVKNFLHAGLGKYSTNTVWRIFWNQFQQHYYCCGVSQSNDWFQTAWVSPMVLSSFSLFKK